MKKIQKVLKSIMSVFNFACIILPFGMASVFALVYISGGWSQIIEGHDLTYYSLPALNHKITAILIILLIAVIFVLLIKSYFKVKNSLKLKKSSNLFTGIVIFVISAVIRLPVVYIFRKDIVPFSDFSRVWNMAHGQFEGNIDYYSLFPSYLNYTVFLKRIISLFGDRYFFVIIINCILASITGSLVYILSERILKNETISIISGLLFVFMPSNIVYCAVGTPEFITILFNVIGTLFLVEVFNCSGKKKYIFMLLGFISLAVGSAYKQFGIIIIIAFFMAFFTKFILSLDKENKAMFLKRAAAFLMIFAISLGSFKLTTALIIADTEKSLGVSINENLSLPHYILIGLNTQSEGQISKGSLSREYYYEYLRNGQDAEAARSYAFDLLSDDLKNNKQEILPNMIKKMIWVWQDDNKPIKYLTHNIGITPGSGIKNILYRFMKSFMGSVEQFYYFVVMLFSLIACIFIFRKKETDYKIEFILLIIFGYFCLMILSEGQSRYKCLIMPYVCILGGYGIYNLFNKILVWRKTNEKSTNHWGGRIHREAFSKRIT